MKKAISIEGAPAPIGPYSQAVLVDNTLYVSGQIPLNPFSGNLVNDSIEEATTQVLENIQSILIAAGFEKNDIVKCSIFLKDMDEFAEMNAIYGAFFDMVPPARETVQVVKLPLDVRIEISCVAVKIR
jgi:2-iminobutanoate/2-iminopropanoate deaminase